MGVRILLHSFQYIDFNLKLMFSHSNSFSFISIHQVFNLNVGIVAQMVEQQPAKLSVIGSNPIYPLSLSIITFQSFTNHSNNFTKCKHFLPDQATFCPTRQGFSNFSIFFSPIGFSFFLRLKNG